ncbi:unnamed protein product [Lampetra fluviatilis]
MSVAVTSESLGWSVEKEEEREAAEKGRRIGGLRGRREGRRRRAPASFMTPSSRRLSALRSLRDGPGAHGCRGCLAMKRLREEPEAQAGNPVRDPSCKGGPRNCRLLTCFLCVRTGVSCDACMKGNFRGRRYKCLICYDYDLCASCYESGATTSRHAADHPMQCILTRVDFDLYYGGEALTAEQPQSFTCPYCGKMGLTEATLQEHVTSEHAEASTEVVCPVCAALPGGDPNHVTDDLAAHLTVEHRTPRDIISFCGIRHMRRVLHPGRGIGVTRVRRSNMHFTGNSTGGGGLSSSSASQGSYSPSAREAMDPIAELLSQLSGVRRVAGGALNPAGSMASQLQQIHMQLQLERQQAQAARHQQQQQQQQQQGGEARSQARQNNNSAAAHGASLVQQQSVANNNNNGESGQSGAANSPFLLDRLNEGQLCDVEQQALECERADHSLFTQELLLSSLLRVADVEHDDDKGGGEQQQQQQQQQQHSFLMGASEIPALDGLSLADHRAVKEPPPPPL